MQKGRVNTKLGQWLKAATGVQQEELCRRSGTSMSYMRLLSNAYRENPKLRLAIAIVEAANAIRLANFKKQDLPEVTLHDLAEPTRRGGAIE